MPFGSEDREKGIALALSGGGFRATLFHLGSAWRLNELGFLAKLARWEEAVAATIRERRQVVMPVPVWNRPVPHAARLRDDLESYESGLRREHLIFVAKESSDDVGHDSFRT